MKILVSKRRRAGMSLLMAGWLLVSGLIVPGEAQEPVRQCSPTQIYCEGDDQPNFETLTLELAQVHKTLADEQFLSAQSHEDLLEATRSYCATEAMLIELDPERLNAATREVYKLLSEDVSYRRLLLQQGFDFWGLRTARPAVPQQQIAYLRDALGKLNEYIREVDGLLDNKKENEDHLDQALLGIINSRANELAQRTRNERFEIEISHFQGTQNRASARRKQILDERLTLEKQADQLSQQADELNAAVGQQIMRLAATSAGVPPGIVDSLQTGNWEKAAVSVLSSPEFINSPAVAGALKDLQESAPRLAETIDDLQELQRQGQDLQKLVEGAKRLQEKPSLENFLAVGEAAWNKVPQEQRTKLTKEFLSQRPVQALVEMTSEAVRKTDEWRAVAERVRSELTEAVAQENIASQLKIEVERYLDQLPVADLKEGYTKIYSESLSQAQLREGAAKRYLDRLARDMPRHFVDWLEAQEARAFGEFLKAAKLDSKADLAEAIRHQGLAAAEGIQVRGRDLILRAGVRLLPNNKIESADYRIASVADAFIELSRPENLEIAEADVRKSVQAMFKALAAEEAALKTVLLESLDTRALENIVLAETSIAGKTPRQIQQSNQWRERVWQGATQSLTGSPQWRSIEKQVTQVALGVAIAQRHLADAPQPGVPPVSSPSVGTDPQQAMLQQAVLTALDAAIPGAGTAIRIVSDMFALEKMWDRLNELFDQQKSLLAEERQLIEAEKNAELQRAIAEKEQTIAQLMRDAATLQMQVWASSLARSREVENKLRAQTRARRPLIFFAADEMRKEFDLLNGAMALWRGELRHRNNYLQSLVGADPNFVRLALDRDIQLYGWLNREREGTRVDVDFLLNDWRKKVDLSESVCRNLGCVPGAGHFGAIEQTGLIPLSQLLQGGTKTRFHELLAGRSGSFQGDFYLLPIHPAFPANVANVRIVDVRMGWLKADGGTQWVQGATLDHPGFGLVGALDSERAGEIILQQEVRAPASKLSFQAPQEFNNIENRWQADQGTILGQKLLPLEGYTPFTLWHIDVPSTNRPVNAKDLVLRFSYFFLRRGTIATDNDFARWMQTRQINENDTARESVRRDFPVPWYTFAAVERRQEQGRAKMAIKLDGFESSWVALLDGLRPPQFGATPGTPAPSQKAGICPDEIAVQGVGSGTPARDDESAQWSIEAVCRSREEVLADLYRHLLQNPPPGETAWSSLKAEAEARKHIGFLDTSKYCPCHAAARSNPKAMNDRCPVAGKI